MTTEKHGSAARPPAADAAVDGSAARDDLILPAAQLRDLPRVMAHVDARFRDTPVPDDVRFAIRLAVEEIFTNVMRHGYVGEPGPIACAVRVDDGEVRVTLTDAAPPFDPADAPTANLEAGVEDRVVGGLGWHLVRQLVDDIHHSPRPSGNVLTLIKGLRGRAS